MTSPTEVGPHWDGLFDAVNRLGRPELDRRWREARQVLRENGVTYNVYGDPTGLGRAWNLDPLPLVIAPADADLLARGLEQRARLLEAVVADIYGPQVALKEGLIPAELVFANPGFLRPLHGLTPAGGRFLHLVAANLGRDSDGNWRVLGDRTQSPSGAGYALENRIVTARALPEAFHDCRVDRLARFFGVLRDQIGAAAPARFNAAPRVVLLTPGPYNETYFEHAYLARYLGLTLVEGGDLTVRDDKVYLKVLGGLQPIDAIFRRLDDDYCDPLELRPDSYLGVPGLVNAVRAGNVAVANALGAGVLESPALSAYLPRLCRHFLSEDLVLPAARAWWLGDAAGRAEALSDLSAVVVKPRFLAGQLEPVVVGELSSSLQEWWRGELAERPEHYVAQERLMLSTVPVLSDDGFVPRKCVLRGYAAAAPNGRFAVMPGGLTRVSATEQPVVTMQGGGNSKDTWFPANGPVSDYTLLPPSGLPVELSRCGGDLPSRAADNLYWLGRHVERADGTARLLRAIVVRLAERPAPGDTPEMPALLGALARLIGPGSGEAHSEALDATFHVSRGGGLGSALANMAKSAGAVRDRISLDMGRAFAEAARIPADEQARTANGSPTISDTLEVLDRAVLALAAVAGMAAEGMTRTDAYHFLDIGRRVERSLYVGNLLVGALSYPEANESPVLDAVLEISDAAMTYRRRYLGNLRPDAVLDLLVFDETNPRSLAAQLTRLCDSVDRLPRSGLPALLAPDRQAAAECLDRVRSARPTELATLDAHGFRPELARLEADLATLLPALSNILTEQYLTHQPASRHTGRDAGAP